MFEIERALRKRIYFAKAYRAKSTPAAIESKAIGRTESARKEIEEKRGRRMRKRSSVGGIEDEEGSRQIRKLERDCEESGDAALNGNQSPKGIA